MTEAVRIIRAEHAGIWRLLATMDRLVQDLRAGDRGPDTALYRSLFDYIEGFTDRMHHPKEDKYLFKALRERNPTSHAILDELQAEHRRGAEVIGRLRSLLDATTVHDPAARSEFCDALTRYTNFQREHIRKEETQVLPMARDSLEEADWAEIDRVFLDNEDPLFGQSVRAEFRDLYSHIVQYAPEPVGLGLAHDVERPRRVEAVLRIQGLDSHYGRIQALDGIELDIAEGELVALVGANGAGKTTLLRTISGLQPASSGRIEFMGEDITRLRPDARVARGISQVPEGRQVFGPLSVEDNLRLGAYHRRAKGNGVDDDLGRMFGMFPILKQKRRQHAGTLSGGQQQMLAMARGLMARPRMLLLDEPSMGLAPLLVQEIFSAVSRLKEQGMTIFLVEQNAAGALAIADRGYVLETGRVVLKGTGGELLANDDVKAAYLGM